MQYGVSGPTIVEMFYTISPLVQLNLMFTRSTTSPTSQHCAFCI